MILNDGLCLSNADLAHQAHAVCLLAPIPLLALHYLHTSDASVAGSTQTMSGDVDDWKGL